MPRLVTTRQGNTVNLQWQTPKGLPFPMPVEVEVDGQVQRLAMTGGKASIAVAPGAHVVVDPDSRILKRSRAVEEFQAWRTAQSRAK